MHYFVRQLIINEFRLTTNGFKNFLNYAVNAYLDKSPYSSKKVSSLYKIINSVRRMQVWLCHVQAEAFRNRINVISWQTR